MQYTSFYSYALSKIFSKRYLIMFLKISSLVKDRGQKKGTMEWKGDQYGEYSTMYLLVKGSNSKK